MDRPKPEEYPRYYDTYVSLVPEGNVVEILAVQMSDTARLLRGLSEEQGNLRYAAGKWSIKDVIGHLIDMERVFQVRALAFARNDPASLPGVEQDDYVANGSFISRRLVDIAAEFEAVRRAGILLFQSFTPETSGRRGIANDASFTAGSMSYIIAGHELHHRRVIETRYL